MKSEYSQHVPSCEDEWNLAHTGTIKKPYWIPNQQMNILLRIIESFAHVCDGRASKSSK